jgi:hypothetical protein
MVLMTLRFMTQRLLRPSKYPQFFGFIVEIIFYRVECRQTPSSDATSSNKNRVRILLVFLVLTLFLGIVLFAG